MNKVEYISKIDETVKSLNDMISGVQKTVEAEITTLIADIEKSNLSETDQESIQRYLLTELSFLEKSFSNA